MRRVCWWIVGLAALVIAGCGSGGASGSASTGGKPAAVATANARGVMTIASDLASECTRRIGSSDAGQPATTKVSSLVDELVEAYTSGPHNEATTGRMQGLVDSMQSCGPDQIETLRSALADSGAAVPEPTPEADPKGKYELNCDYVLGDFNESGDPLKGFRFIGGGTVRNTGNVGIKIRVTFTWQQLGANPVRSRKVYRIGIGKHRNVKATVPVDQNAIDLHQSASGKCSSRATIVGTFGKPKDV